MIEGDHLKVPGRCRTCNLHQVIFSPKNKFLEYRGRKGKADESGKAREEKCWRRGVRMDHEELVYVIISHWKDKEKE